MEDNKQTADNIQDNTKKLWSEIVATLREYIADGTGDKECDIMVQTSYMLFCIHSDKDRFMIIRPHKDLFKKLLFRASEMLAACIDGGVLDDAKSDDFSLNVFIDSLVDALVDRDEAVRNDMDEETIALVSKYHDIADEDVKNNIRKALTAAVAAAFRVRYEHRTKAQVIDYLSENDRFIELIDPVITYDWARQQGIHVDYYIDGLENLEMSEEEKNHASDVFDDMAQRSGKLMRTLAETVEEDFLPASREWLCSFLNEHGEAAQQVFCTTIAFIGLMPDRGIKFEEKLTDKAWFEKTFDIMANNFFGTGLKPHVLNPELRSGFLFAVWSAFFVSVSLESFDKPLLCKRGQASDDIIEESAKAVKEKYCKS